MCSGVDRHSLKARNKKDPVSGADRRLLWPMPRPFVLGNLFLISPYIVTLFFNFKMS